MFSNNGLVTFQRTCITKHNCILSNLPAWLISKHNYILSIKKTYPHHPHFGCVAAVCDYDKSLKAMTSKWTRFSIKNSLQVLERILDGVVRPILPGAEEWGG